MQIFFTNRNAGEVVGELLLRREKALRNRRYRDNVTDFIALLSHYISSKPALQAPATTELYEHLCKKHGARPYGGYAVRIAIEKLPGNLKKNSSKKQKQ